MLAKAAELLPPNGRDIIKLQGDYGYNPRAQCFDIKR